MKAWDPNRHPRHPAGSESGGEFRPLYHGTNVLLAPGEVVTSAKELGYQRPGELPSDYDPALVYMSTGDHLAERYAVAKAGKEGGEPHVYEVEPVGEIALDPEAESGFGTDQRIAPAARVVREVPLPGLSHWDDGLKRGPRPVWASAEEERRIAPDIVSDVAEWGERPIHGKDFKDMSAAELAHAEKVAAQLPPLPHQRERA